MYLRPRTLGEACEALARAPAVVLAGGTDVFPALGERPAPERIVDISGLPCLAGIAVDADAIRIGAGTTWSAIAQADLPPAFDALMAAARSVGARQVQNAGTLGGNLCHASPAADGVPPLLALDAEVELASATGARRLPLADFILGSRRTARAPGEILSAVVVPRRLEKARSAFLKLGARRYLVISIAMVAAAVLRDERGRVAWAGIAVGSCSAVARRLPGLEAALAGARAGTRLSDLAEPAHLTCLSPIDDVRGTAAYRTDAALELVRRALDACEAPG